MNKLFNRVCDVLVAGKKFSFPPFSIEFTQTAKANGIMTATMKLYNPNDLTIKGFEIKKIAGVPVYPKVIVTAGYKEKFGTCIIGNVNSYTVKQERPDRILECKIGDATSEWVNNKVFGSYSNMPAQNVMAAMLASAGVAYSSITLGKQEIIDRITFKDNLSQELRNLCKKTDSSFTWKNGLLKIYPNTSFPKKAALISKDSGLLGVPEKTERGAKFKTLFLYDLVVGDQVLVQTGIEKKQTLYEILEYKKIFSTFGDASCEFDAKTVK